MTRQVRRTLPTSSDVGGTPRRRLSRSPVPAGYPPLPVSPQYGPIDPGVRERETRTSGPPEGTPLPLAYGRCRIGGDIIVVGKHTSGNLVIGYAFTLASQGVGTIEREYLNNETASALGATLTFQDGLQTAPPAKLKQTYSAHAEAYAGLCWALLDFSASSSIFGASPELQYLGTWRKIYNPATGAFEASSNPALIALDLIRSLDAAGLPDSAIDLTSFQDVAAYCDTLISGVARYRAGGLLHVRGNAVAEAARLLTTFGGGIVLSPDGKLTCWMRRDDVDASGEIAPNTQIVTTDGAHLAAQVEMVPATEIADRVGMRYLDPDRAEEQTLWWQHPSFQLGDLTSGGERTVGGEMISDPYTAARLAADTGIAMAVAPQRIKAQMLDAVAVGSVWRLDPFGTAPIAAVADTQWTATGVGGSVPGTQLNISARFRLDSGSGNLISLGTSPNGFGISVAKNSLTVRLADKSYTLPAVIPYGVPVSMELIWRASDGQLMLYQHGELISSATTSGVSTVATTANYTIGGFAGAIEWVLTGGAYNLFQTRFRSSWSFRPPGNWDVYWLRGTYQRGSGDKPTLTTMPPAFWCVACDPLPDGTYATEWQEWHVRSRAGANTESSGSILVQRQDTKAAITQHSPADIPPPVGNLALSAIEDTSVTPSRWRINAQWEIPNDPFIRGYMVTVTCGGTTMTVGTFGRTTGACTVPVIAVGQRHTVAIYTLNQSGKKSNGVSAFITPGSGAFSVSISASNAVETILPVNGALGIGMISNWVVHRRVSISVSVTGSQYVDRVEIQVGGVVAGALPASGGNVDIWCGTPGDYYPYSPPAGSILAAFGSRTRITAVAIGKDGRRQSASTIVPAFTRHIGWTIASGTLNLRVYNGRLTIEP